MLGTAGQVRTNSQAAFFYRLLHIATLVLANQQKLIFISFVQILDAM